MYHSQVARWSSVDPEFGNVDSPQTLNRYTYVYNNPANLIDPAGDLARPPRPRGPVGLDMPTPCAVPYIPVGGFQEDPPPLPGFCSCWLALGTIRALGCAYICPCPNGLRLAFFKCSLFDDWAFRLCPAFVTINSVTNKIISPTCQSRGVYPDGDEGGLGHRQANIRKKRSSKRRR